MSVRVKIWKKRHSDKIAVLHIKFISSILKIYDFPYLNTLLSFFEVKAIH